MISIGFTYDKITPESAADGDVSEEHFLEERLAMVRYEKRRGFQPPWYTVIIFKCECGETCLRKSWRGPTPPGGIFCPTKTHLLGFNGTITLYPRG